jgi:8-amino-7-oxononanoate synthase
VSWDDLSWADAIEGRNAAIRRSGRWRTIRPIDEGTPATHMSATGQPVVSFASNDYLGLTQHPAVVAAAGAALERLGSGAGAARLIVGGRPLHDELESDLASWCQRDAALLFPTGFQANLGIVGALVSAAGRDRVLVLSDELNHASIIEAIRAARCEVAVYRHADVDHVRELLAERGERLALVVSDAVFSMDGDVAPVDELAQVASENDALLVLDEAHAVLGPPAPRGSIVVGTLSKTFGSLGGFVAADRAVIDLCRNSSRSFIFTTASTPADTAAALAAVQIVRSSEGKELIDRLHDHVELLRPGHGSPIIPVMLGDEARTVEASAALLAEGFLVPAIRPPTVAPGSCRLRIALSAAHDPADIERLGDALAKISPA